MTPDLQAKVDEIRERQPQLREIGDRLKTSAAYAKVHGGEVRIVAAKDAWDIGHAPNDIDTLLAALDAANQRGADAERVEREAAVAWLRKVASDYRNSIFFEAGIVTPAIQDEARADAIARGKHREGKGDG